MAITIKYSERDDIAWDGLSFDLIFGHPIGDDVDLQLRDLINSWFLVGLYAGFGGNIHQIEWQDGGMDRKSLAWIVDMGSAHQRAVEVLVDILGRFADLNDLPEGELVVGEE